MQFRFDPHWRGAWLALALAAFAQAAAAHIVAAQAWARPTVAGQPAGGGFVRLINQGKQDDRLIAASSPVAQRMEIHHMVIENNVMRMREVQGGVAIKAGETLELKPGGLHVMFLDLKQPLQRDSKVPVTLEFEKAGKVNVEFVVQPRAPEADGGHASHH